MYESNMRAANGQTVPDDIDPAERPIVEARIAGRQAHEAVMEQARRAGLQLVPPE